MSFSNQTKFFIYGMPKYGKSKAHVAPILQKETQFLYVTYRKGIEEELENMGLPKDYISIVELNHIPKKLQKTGTDVGKYHLTIKREKFLELLKEIEDKEITKDKNNTIILNDAPYELLAREDFIERIEKWDAKVYIECMCYRIDIESGYYDHILNSDKWLKISVF